MPTLAALEELARRGATPGERKAARNALDKLRAKLRVAPKPRSAPRFRGFYDPSNVIISTNDSIISLLLKMQAEQASAYRAAQARTRQPSATEDVRFLNAFDVAPHPTEAARVIVEAPTRAAMFDTLRECTPITIRWRGSLYRTEGYAGTFEDRDVHPPRFYVTINTARLTKV